MNPNTFKITRLRDGGYMVWHSSSFEMDGGGAIFASSKIGEALEYIREKLTADRAPDARQ